MGLARGAAALLLEECVRKPFSGRIATLGVQTVYMTPADLTRQFERFGVKPAVPMNSGTPLDDKLLFRMMGFEAIETLDYSDFEGADHVVDLNQEGLPEDLRGNFDVVLDSGTLEHVFHVPNALKNIVSLVKVGGRIIFLSPSSNHMDHGFYMFSPTFFVDYFMANLFDIEKCYVVRYSPNLDELWDVYEYDLKRWRDLHIGGLDDKAYAIFFVATRRPDLVSDRTPQQGYYADNSPLYTGARIAGAGTEINDAGTLATGACFVPPPALDWQDRVRNLLRHVPILLRLARGVRRKVAKKFLNKRLVGRF